MTPRLLIKTHEPDQSPSRISDQSSSGKNRLSISSILNPHLHEALGKDPKLLISQEQIDYYKKLCSYINPDSKDFHVAYAGSGPDLVTPLLTSNATKVLSLDRIPVYAGALQDAHRYPQLRTSSKQNQFLEDLEHRYQEGYWLESSIHNHYIENLIAYELRELGVKRDDALIKRKKNGDISVKFDWAYPGQIAKEREFIFRQAFLPELVEDLDYSQLDMFLQKSAFQQQNHECINKSLATLSKKMNKGSFVVLGAPLRDNYYKAGSISYVSNSQFSRYFEQIDPDFEHQFSRPYGVNLELAKLK